MLYFYYILTLVIFGQYSRNIRFVHSVFCSTLHFETPPVSYKCRPHLTHRTLWCRYRHVPDIKGVNVSSHHAFNVWMWLLLRSTVMCGSHCLFTLQRIHRASKTVQNCFCQNFIKFPPILIIFDRKMAKRLKLYEVYSFSTSPNSGPYSITI